MRNTILNKIKEMKYTTFAELTSIPGFIGEYSMVNEEPNVMYWDNMSTEAIKVLNKLLQDKEIYMIPDVTPLGLGGSYIADGVTLTIQIVGANPPKRGYKTTRWLPVLITTEK